MERFIDTSILVLMLASGSLVAAWIAGAIYFDVCGETRWGRWLALGWVGGVIALFAVWRPLWQPFIVFAGVSAAFIVWWLRLKPSHDRDWSPEVAVLPHAERSGDAITIHDVRNFEYPSQREVMPRYQTR